MRIALIAHDSRKELLAQFCTAYVRILSQNELVATGVTGKELQDACPLPVRSVNPPALCDVHNIPIATNIATAEVLIHGLERGDLAWIELQRGRK